MVTYESLDHIGANFSSLAYNLQRLTPCFKCFIHMKSNFKNKYGTSHWEISVYCTVQECSNVTTPYYPISILAYGRLKTKENFTLLALKVVAIAYKRWSLTRGSKYSDHFDLETFGVLENCSLRRGGHLWEVMATGGSTLLLNNIFEISINDLSLENDAWCVQMSIDNTSHLSCQTIFLTYFKLCTAHV